MTEELKLPEPLSVAVAHIEELRGIVAASYSDLDGNVHLSRVSRVSREIAACDEAIAAIRAEHAQRITLQHHAADMAQRVDDLAAERDELRARLAELVSALDSGHGLTIVSARDRGEAVLAKRKGIHAPAIPAGWKLVPVEPTEKMIGEGACATCLPGPHYIGVGAAKNAWRFMLAAAPEVTK